MEGRVSGVLCVTQMFTLRGIFDMLNRAKF